jgi:hypothetical protein
MIATRFRSVGLVAGVAVAALGCYLVSQRVATERAVLAKVERQIASGERDIRLLRMEIATRSRMPQLDRWNAGVLGLTAPETRQFLDSEVRLASLNQPAPLPLDPAIVAQQGAVRTVSFQPAKSPPAATQEQPAAEPMLRQASYIRPKLDRVAPEPTKIALLPADIGSLAAAERAAPKTSPR